MNRSRKLALSTAPAAAALLVAGALASPARAASLTQVSRSTWTNGVNLPSYLQMYIYVPDKVATKPPIVVSAHSCGSTASGQMGNIPMFKSAADSNGFILVLPDNPNQNCWDVGSPKALMHDGGGDTQGVALMVKYALMKYNGDASRVYIMGGSSGAMLTQAMLAVYPDLFRAGAARAGVPAGCWAVSYDSGQQWSTPCATGMVSNSAMSWGDMVRQMDPTYTGHRPRLQLMQGENDTTIYYENMGESIKEWTNVLGLPTTPTSTDKSYKGAVATWDRQFWSNTCGYTVLEAWSAPGQTHSMGYEEAAMIKFFGLDMAGGADPEPDCTGSGAGGAAGANGAGGAAGTGGVKGTGGSPAAGTGGSPATGTGGTSGGSTGGSSGTGSGGTQGPGTGSGGRTGSGGVEGSGGATAATGGVSGTGGGSAIATGGTTGSGGSSGSSGSGGSKGSGGSSSSGSGSGGSSSGSADNGSSGGCAVGGAASRSTAALGIAFLAVAGMLGRRRRRR